MFNSYTYEKQLALSKEIDKIKKKYLFEREQRKGNHLIFLQSKITDMPKTTKSALKTSLSTC